MDGGPGAEWFTDDHFVVFWIEDARRDAHAQLFLEELKKENAKVASDAASVEAAIRRFAKTGTLRNQQKFVALGNGTVEFKAHQIRIFGVLHGRHQGKGRLFLTHGVKKKRNQGIPGIVDIILEKLGADPDWTED